MNRLIYDGIGTLHIRTSNGLEWSYTETDRPDLGFDYVALVYDDVEFKVVDWKSGVELNEQETVKLTDDEKDAIELYLENVTPPAGVNLNQQVVNELTSWSNRLVKESLDKYGFDDLSECMYAGRPGSNHPHRNNSRLCMEFLDAVFCQLDLMVDEIVQTREDFLKSTDFYISRFPVSVNTEDQFN